MERAAALGREAAAVLFAAEDSLPSRCSSGCQSGWTVYLDHSNGGHRCIPCEPAPRWTLRRPAEEDEEEDSMVSDASSGPAPPRPREEDEEEVLLRRDHKQLRQFLAHRCYSSNAATGGSGSGCFGSTLPASVLRSEVKSRDDRTAAAVVQGGAAAHRQYRHVDREDDLDDTASSSGVFSHPTAYIAGEESWTVAG